MKTKTLPALAALFCLTSCAPLLTQPKVSQIRPGVTTEANLVALFGPPDTRQMTSDHRDIYLNWIRSEPIPPEGYAPLVGSVIGGMNVNVEQLSVHLDGAGRVIRYSVYDSKGEVQSEKYLHGLPKPAGPNQPAG